MAKLFDRLVNTAVTSILSKADNNIIFGEYYKRSEKASPIDWTKQPQQFKSKTIEDWINAVMAATNPEDPRRGQLMRFFNSLKLDLHLMSCVDNRILPIQCAPFKLIDKSKKEVEDVHYLFERPWFIDLSRIMLMQTFEGTKLIEMIKLNDKLELAEVKEIEQSNFLPDRGLVIKEEFDTKGVDYKSGIYANYYVQIGTDWSLGLFNEIAMIVLAKKLGLGSWMSYIEKFGVPAVFVTTDRFDDNRLKELYNMMLSFRSNHFILLQGNEKIEIPKDTSTDGYQSFINLNAFADAQLSKRILGGTGVSDEKSFVGSAELHERMLQYRIKVDKLIFKFYMNEEIIPRLVKLSSVYAPLANLTFEWDETESLTLKEKIQAVKDLAQYFDFDPEKLAELTGLPITTVKETIQKVEEAQKKKPNASVKGARNYSLAPFAQSTHHLFAATWDAAISRLADQIWNGEVLPSDLDRDLVLKNYSSLSKASQMAWGDDYYTDAITRQFRENLLKFSGAKANNLMQDLNALKRSGIDKDAFITEAKKMVSLHNETWLNTEAKFAANKTSTAKDFQQFVKDIDIYPNLKNRTFQDENVRDTHAANEGIVKPVNEWTHTPPYDPGCRCWLEQTSDQVTEKGITGVSPKWATNPIKSGMLFSEQHSYFEAIPAKQLQLVRANTELMKQYAPYNKVINTVGGNRVYVNDFADLSDVDENVTAAKKIADELNKDIYVRHHIESGNVTGHKNAEFGIETPNKLGDLKTFRNPKKSLQKFITNRISDCDDQLCKYAVLDITAYEKDDLNIILKRRLCGELTDKLNKNITDVVIIRGDNVSKITRKQVNNRDFESFLKGL